MKRLVIVLALGFSNIAFANTVNINEADLVKLSMHGDYQAQRNLSFSYATGWSTPDKKNYIPKSLEKACVWFKVILISKSKKVDVGDYSNDWTYCRNLDAQSYSDTWAAARKINADIK